MLIKLLPEPETKLLLDLAELLALSDNPALWDGKKYDELTSETDLSNLSIQINEQENELIADLEHSAGHPAHRESNWLTTSVKDRLVEQLKTFAVQKVELPETRVAASQAVLAQLLENQSTTRPETPKIMLFEMFLVALRDGTISSIEFELLKAFQRHYQLEDFIFDDLQERAEALNAEVSKTIALVLE